MAGVYGSHLRKAREVMSLTRQPTEVLRRQESVCPRQFERIIENCAEHGARQAKRRAILGD
jgi:hypothetical protein